MLIDKFILFNENCFNNNLAKGALIVYSWLGTLLNQSITSARPPSLDRWRRLRAGNEPKCANPCEHCPTRCNLVPHQTDFMLIYINL